MPLRRMNAITTSIRSADATSARTWLPTLGSPGAFVSNVVSSSRMSGSSMTSAVPSGRRAVIDRNTDPGSTGRSGVRSSERARASTSSARRATRSRATAMATSTRSSSLTPSMARSTTRPRCSATRSATSAARTTPAPTTSRSPNDANCSASTS